MARSKSPCLQVFQPRTLRESVRKIVIFWFAVILTIIILVIRNFSVEKMGEGLEVEIYIGSY